MPEQTIDPIFAPSALNGILSKMRDDDTFGSCLLYTSDAADD